jgi:MFS family permease
MEPHQAEREAAVAILKARSPGNRTPVWIAASQIAVVYAGSTMLTPLYRLYREAFGFSKLTLTLVYAAYVVGNLVALLVLGRLSDQAGRRRANLVALVLALLATLLFLAASDIWWLVAGRIVSGLAIGLAASAATAWVAELEADKREASVYTTAGNFAGLAFGALLAGLSASYLPWPLRLSYVVYLALLFALAALLWRMPETVKAPIRQVEELSLRPRIGIPRELFAPFVAPAVTAFATFAVIGYYSALIPSLMAEALREPSPAAGGGIVALMLALGFVASVLTRRLSSRAAMLCGLALLLPGVALMPLAELRHSLALLLCGAALTGPAAVLSYRGSLQVVNEMAPAERRGEMTASYILFCYAGNSLPIVGVGVLSTITKASTADVTFAIIIAALAAAALVTGALRLRSGGR